MVVLVVVDVGMPARVSAGFGIEGRFDLHDMAAQGADHLGDYVIGPDADVCAHELHWQMPVAEVPGDADEFGRAVRMDVEQGLGLSDDPDDAAATLQQ